MTDYNDYNNGYNNDHNNSENNVPETTSAPIIPDNNMPGDTASPTIPVYSAENFLESEPVVASAAPAEEPPVMPQNTPPVPQLELETEIPDLQSTFVPPTPPVQEPVTFQEPAPPTAPAPQPQFPQQYQQPTYTASYTEPVNYQDTPPVNNYQNPQEHPQIGPQGSPIGQAPQYPTSLPYFQAPPGYPQKSRLAAALLGVLLGTFGVHNFYLGFKTRAIVQVLLSTLGGVITCGVATVIVAIWGMIEGILLLIGNDNRNFDGNNIILRD
jgi:Predicted membrane protein